VFVTLKDETGNVNIIIWPTLLEKQRKGGAQCVAAGGLRHLLAQRLVDMSHLLGGLHSGLHSVSRNFC